MCIKIVSMKKEGTAIAANSRSIERWCQTVDKKNHSEI
jgi:hypothetical protein